MQISLKRAKKLITTLHIFLKLLGEADETHSSQSQVKIESNQKHNVHGKDNSLFQKRNQGETNLKLLKIANISLSSSRPTTEASNKCIVGVIFRYVHRCSLRYSRTMTGTLVGGIWKCLKITVSKLRQNAIWCKHAQCH